MAKHPPADPFRAEKFGEIGSYDEFRRSLYDYVKS
jgi:hypothetical protein